MRPLARPSEEMGRTVRCFPAAGIPGSGACAAARRVPVLLAALPQRCSGLHGSFLAEVELGSSRARSWGREPGLKEPRVTGVGPELPWPGKRRPKSRDAVALSAVGRTMGNEGKRSRKWKRPAAPGSDRCGSLLYARPPVRHL